MVLKINFMVEFKFINTNDLGCGRCKYNMSRMLSERSTALAASKVGKDVCEQG